MHPIVGHWEHFDGDIGLIKDGKRETKALLPEYARVIEAGRVDKDAGAQPREFDGFPDRIGRRSGNLADKRDLLSRDGVDQRRLPAIGRPEKSDVYTFHKLVWEYLLLFQDRLRPRSREWEGPIGTMGGKGPLGP